MHLLEILLVLTFVRLCQAGLHSRNCGLNEKFENGRCKPCPKCGVGYGLVKDCGFGLGAGLQCKLCPANTYNHDPNERICIPCTNCTFYNRDFIYRCRPQVNAECGKCIYGFYDEYKELEGIPCKSCKINPTNEDCKRYQKEVIPPSTTHFESKNVSSSDDKIYHMGPVAAALVIGVAFLLLLLGFTWLFIRYKKTQRFQLGVEVGTDSGSVSGNSTAEKLTGIGAICEGSPMQNKLALWNENFNSIVDAKPSTSGVKLIQNKVKTKLQKEQCRLQTRGKVIPIEETDSVTSHVAVKDSSSSSGDSPMSSSEAENDDTDITISDTASLLEEQGRKSKSNSLKSDSSKSGMIVNLDNNGIAKYSRGRKKVPRRYHRSVSEQDSLAEEANEINTNYEIPQADVRQLSPVTAPSAPPASYVHDGDVHEMETLLIRSHDVDDVASLANRPSLASNYSTATTVPIRSLCPAADGVTDLLSLDTMSDNILFPALVADPAPVHNNLSPPKATDDRVASAAGRAGDVDACPDFGLGSPNNQNDSSDLGFFEDFLKPPPAPSMDHIRQLLRYELPLPGYNQDGACGSTTRRNPENQEPTVGDTEPTTLGDQGSHVGNRPARIWVNWNDTERELFDAEKDAEVLYKMAKALDGERYARALRVAAEKQIGELNYEVQEQVSLAMNSRGMAGDRNYIHLALRLGIPEPVIRNLPGMMEVFGHLTMRRITIGEFLRTLRVMERHDVVNMISGAILDSADCFVDPRNDDGDDPDGDDGESILPPPQQEQGSLFEKEFPYPIQECAA